MVGPRACLCRPSATLPVSAPPVVGGFAHHQGHSILITSDSAVCQDAVEIHGVAPEGVGNVVDLIEPQDVEGEAAQDGQDGRALADAAGVLVHGNVQYVVDPVLHAPMAARRGSVMLGAGALAGRCIPCNFAGALPFPANGDILALNPAGEANRLDDVGAPLRKVENAACAEYFEDALFLAVAPYFAALHMAIIRLVPDRQGLERRFEAWLVALDLE